MQEGQVAHANFVFNCFSFFLLRTWNVTELANVAELANQAYADDSFIRSCNIT